MSSDFFFSLFLFFHATLFFGLHLTIACYEEEHTILFPIAVLIL